VSLDNNGCLNHVHGSPKALNAERVFARDSVSFRDTAGLLQQEHYVQVFYAYVLSNDSWMADLKADDLQAKARFDCTDSFATAVYVKYAVSALHDLLRSRNAQPKAIQ
jgi:hypothetical protein